MVGVCKHAVGVAARLLLGGGLSTAMHPSQRSIDQPRLPTAAVLNLGYLLLLCSVSAAGSKRLWPGAGKRRNPPLEASVARIMPG